MGAAESAPAAPASTSVATSLLRLKAAKEKGEISEQEYEAEIKVLLQQGGESPKAMQQQENQGSENAQPNTAQAPPGTEQGKLPPQSVQQSTENGQPPPSSAAPAQTTPPLPQAVPSQQPSSAAPAATASPPVEQATMNGATKPTQEGASNGTGPAAPGGAAEDNERDEATEEGGVGPGGRWAGDEDPSFEDDADDAEDFGGAVQGGIEAAAARACVRMPWG
eukprot:CAMPEP_0181315352 /NCGR_PEP_ID=MMETSP1101-20121128/15329_1 /TAXON_ID=46948 /ORGANISM="Rhodomonas abbreviata, Strain Caron Lab Isolate" /LENGTH=221 /DNA_ID=CAMNT_0023422553 /DNA_START=23 /DNA_END=684 /DNA_ORIENTATION=+